MPVAFRRDTWEVSIETINLKGTRVGFDLSFDRVTVVSKLSVARLNTSPLFSMVTRLVASAAPLLLASPAITIPARQIARAGIITIHRCRFTDFSHIACLSR